jgi:hypothetical protein
MKTLTILIILIFLCPGCKKDEFDPDHPNVVAFVQQIKNGTYNCYEKNDKGQKLWPVMPEFTKDHIQSLLTFANDTSHIAIFPTNPMSSRKPFPVGREYFILGECLLWTVEGIRNGNGYGSLDPFLIDSSKAVPTTGLNGKEILLVRNLYQEWWNDNKNQNWRNTDPLDGKPYRWF